MKNKLYSLIVLFFLLICFGCSDESSSNSAGDNSALIEKVWDYSKSNPNGFTINICDWTVPEKGIAVSYASTQNSFDKEALTNVVEHSLKHDCFVGGWLDDGKYYYDSVKLFSEDSLDQAKSFGIQEKQMAIYIISKDSTVYLE